MYQSYNDIDRGCLLLFISFVSFIAFIYFSYTTFMHCGFHPSKNPTVEGIIVKSAIEKSNFERRRGYKIGVTYEYFVNGKKYLSDMICCGESSNESSRSIINKYPLNSRVTVYYRDKKPYLSVIEPRLGRSGIVMSGMSAFLFISTLMYGISITKKYIWVTPAVVGIFIISSAVFSIIYPPSNEEAALNSTVTSIVFHTLMFIFGLVFVIFSYILKRKNA